MQQNLDTQWPALEGPASEAASLDIWGFFQRRKSFLIVFAIIGAGLGYLLFQQKIPQYRSVARVEVIHRVSESVFQGLLGKDMLADAMFVIPSPEVLVPAYQNTLKALSLETLRGLSEAEAVAAIARGLTINQLSQGIIELQFEGPNPQDATRIANAVADEYIERQKSSFETETQKLAVLLDKDREDIQQQLNQARADYEDFIQQARLLATYDINQSQSRLSALSAKISQLDIEEAELVSRLSLFDRNFGNEDQRAALLVLVGKELDTDENEDVAPPEAVAPSPAADAQRQRDEARLASRLRLSQTLLPLVVDAAVLEKKVGAGHPRLQEVRQRIELIRREHAKMEGMIPDPVPLSEPKAAPVQPDPKATPDYLAVFQQALTHELAELRSERDKLRELAEIAEEQAYQFSKDKQTELQLQRKVELLEEQYSSIATKIGETELNAEYSGVRADKIMPASAGVLVYPIRYRFLGFGAFLGAIAGLAFGYLVELADRSFRKPDEVIREFGCPILGHVPYMKTQQKKKGSSSENADELDSTLVCAHLPRSRPAEAYRSVRTTVCFAASSSSPRILQITSPAAGDGKSTLAANLAVSLAQSGKSTILVESDFRRPNVHKLTGVSNETGIVDVLRGNAELTDAIQTVDVDELSVLPCGKRPGNPSELLSRPEYEQLLDVLREKYEYVVVDSPPVLVVADASSVAPRADAVIMCIRLNRHTRDMGRRAFEQLRDIGANVVGMVINGVEQSDAYGYGAYNYSDYRSYANPYAYKYAYSYANEAYFAEEDDSDPDPVKRLIAKGEEDG